MEQPFEDFLEGTGWGRDERKVCPAPTRPQALVMLWIPKPLRQVPGASFHTGGSQGSEMLTHFPNVPQQGVSIQTQALLPPEPGFLSPSPLAASLGRPMRI